MRGLQRLLKVWIAEDKSTPWMKNKSMYKTGVGFY